MPDNAQAAIPELLQIAKTAALEAGKAILHIYQTGDVAVAEKPDHSPITLADRAAHDIIATHLQQTAYPILSEEGTHAAYELRKDWDWYWLVDPLDGTKEFLKRNGEFTVNIALMQGQTPIAGVVYAPVLDALYVGAKESGAVKVAEGKITVLQYIAKTVTMADLLAQPEVRVIASRSHLTPETLAFTAQFKQVDFVAMGSSLKFMLLAEGKADIYPRFAPTMEWDTAASHAILRALGRDIYHTDVASALRYNKPDLHNPSFISL